MSDRQFSDAPSLSAELTQLQTATLELAETHRHDPQALMALLRQLEGLHRQIREELFVPLLPENRHDLYNLLRDIEENGGWPYIERMRLRAFLSSPSFADLANACAPKGSKPN